MTLAEQETIISFDRGSDDMTIYTANPYTMARLSKLPAYTKIKEDKAGGEVVAMTFTAHKKLLTLRTKRKNQS